MGSPWALQGHKLLEMRSSCPTTTPFHPHRSGGSNLGCGVWGAGGEGPGEEQIPEPRAEGGQKHWLGPCSAKARWAQAHWHWAHWFGLRTAGRLAKASARARARSRPITKVYARPCRPPCVVWGMGGWGGGGGGGGDRKSTCDYPWGDDPQNLSIPGINKQESNATANSIARTF